MKFGIRKKEKPRRRAAVQTVSSDCGKDLLGLSSLDRQSRAERELFASLREGLPIIDAAIWKIVRLIGKFKIITDEPAWQSEADEFAARVRTNGSLQGINNFVYTYLDSLLTYGCAVGEMVPCGAADGISALYNASLDDVELVADGSPLEVTVCRRTASGIEPVKNRELVLATLLNPKPGTIHGTSILSGLPFVSSILLRIFNSVKTNWERIGDVRFAVTYNPPDGEGFSKEDAKIIADEWKKAMRSSSVCDFVSVGDVSIRVIGAESQMPDCEVPIRSVMEQILAKLGIPPFLLGLSWSSTERMSEQQADILTSELSYYRAAVEPVIIKTVKTHLQLRGCFGSFKVEWENINLQDAVELSQARLNNAQAMQIENETGELNEQNQSK